tara:strand:+ start:1904 stop:2047 length:144 start_codon:yes stop_codon:yes gene_type:complete
MYDQTNDIKKTLKRGIDLIQILKLEILIFNGYKNEITITGEINFKKK